MRRGFRLFTLIGLGFGAWAGPVSACAPDAVEVGRLCVDKYEASVWKIVPENTALIAAVKAGSVTGAAQLTANGAVRRGDAGDDYGTACPDTAEHCKRLYAVSIPGVRPSAHMTWFQALALCRNAGKRLLTNAEWQQAALGTADPGTDNDTTDCNISNDLALDPTATGSRGLCVSASGAYDMVGNLTEWTAEWMDYSSSCELWIAGDVSCVGGAHVYPYPVVPGRGGSFQSGPAAGVFHIAAFGPGGWQNYVGFRCAR